MRIRIEPDGTVELDVADEQQAEAAVRLVNRLRPGITASVTSGPAREKVEEGVETEVVYEHSNEHTMTASQYEFWAYMVEHDKKNGIHISSLARRFRLSTDAASHRGASLIAIGAAERPRRGYYRAIQ